MSDWQPIDTAPIGIEIIVVDNEGTVRMAVQIYTAIWKSELDHGDSCATIYWNKNEITPVMWMHKPVPPI